jgi:hypothetical protein
MDNMTDPRMKDVNKIRKILYTVYVEWPTK